MPEFTVTEAKAQLSKLLEMVERGERVLIRRGKKVVAEMVEPKKNRAREPGLWKGKIWYSDDFDEPLHDFIDAFYDGSLPPNSPEFENFGKADSKKDSA